MPKDEAHSPRTTVKMGHDTIQDPPRKEMGPRGTQVLAPKAEPAPKNDADVVVLGVARKPKQEVSAKVDVSRVDPRRAPTQLQSTRRRPPPGAAPVARTDRKALYSTLAILVLLVIAAGVLAFIVYQQRTGKL